MAKVKIIRPSTNYTTVLQGKKKDLLNFLSDVAHSIGPMISRGMLHPDDPVPLAFPATVTQRGSSDNGRTMNWYAEELPSLKAERRRLAKKLAKGPKAKAELELSGR